VAFLRRFEQQLHAQADAEQRAIEQAQRRDQVQIVQPLHRRCRSPHAGKDHAIGASDAVAVAGQLRIHAQPLQRIAHRTDIGASGIDENDTHQSVPLVLARAVPSRRIAERKARATDLKQASTM
jgi:hypothetical protein